MGGLINLVYPKGGTMIVKIGILGSLIAWKWKIQSGGLFAFPNCP